MVISHDQFLSWISIRRIELGKNVICEVQSKYLLQNFTYHVIANGKVIHAETVEVPNNNRHTFKFMATFDLVPNAKIIVYCFHDREFISASIQINIEEDLNNFIKLKLSKSDVKPGEEVSIEVITKAASHVGLVGVDQSVLLLKKNKGLTREDVVNEMNQYQNQYHNVGDGPWTVDEPSNYYYYDRPSAKAFEESNLLIFSNGIKEGKQIITPILITFF